MENKLKAYKVSILVPVYGVEKYIEKCVRSLMTQTYKNIEYVFVNDCTKDKSIEIIESVINEYPDRKNSVIIVNHEQNSGLGAARNTAIKNATGEFIMHVDSDDFIRKECVQKCVEAQQSVDADVVSFGKNEIYVDYSRELLPPKTSDKEEMLCAVISRKCSVAIWGRLIRKSLYTNNDLKVDPRYNIGEDYQITPLLFYYAKRIVNIQEVYYEYNRTNVNSYIWSYSEKVQKEDFESQKIVYNFFCDKGQQYVDAFQKCRQRTIIRSMKSTLLENKDRQYFYELRESLLKIDRSYREDTDFFERAFFYISNFDILRMYLKLSMFVKHKVLNK